MFTPIRKDMPPHQAPQNVPLEDVINQLEMVGQSYNENFTTLSETIGSVIDLNEQLFDRRKLLVESAVEKLKGSMKTTALIEREGADYDDLDELREAHHNLEEEKRRLLLELKNIKAKNEEISKDKKLNSERLAQLSSKNKALLRNENENLPMLTFIRKVLVATSSVTLHKQKDPNTIEGFVGKSDKKEVVPFSYNLSDPSCEYVKHIWDIIME